MSELNKEFFKEKVNNARYALPVAAAGLVTMPALAFAEGESSSTVQSAVNGVASTVVTDGTSMLSSLITTYAPLIAAVIVAGIGISMVKRFGNKSR